MSNWWKSRWIISNWQWIRHYKLIAIRFRILFFKLEAFWSLHRYSWSIHSELQLFGSGVVENDPGDEINWLIKVFVICGALSSLPVMEPTNLVALRSINCNGIRMRLSTSLSKFIFRICWLASLICINLHVLLGMLHDLVSLRGSFE